MRLHLKTAIWATGKSQRRIAADTCISENRLSEIVCGWVGPSEDEKQRIADALGRDVRELFSECSEPAVA
jgi:transcriptional regulator with XRE-family HTH domain